MAPKKPDSKAAEKAIYIIAGNDYPLVNLECEKLINRLLSPEEKITSLFDADPDKTEINSVLDELRTIGFLSKRRVVLIKSADKFISKYREHLEKYFDAPSSTGILVMTVESWRSNTNLAKKLPKTGELINITIPKGPQLLQRLVQYASDTYAKKLNHDAAGMLSDLIGDNIVQIYSEIDKLALLADSEKTITTEHVSALAGHSRMFNAFNVIDQITKSNTAKAVDLLRSMFAEDKDAQYTVVGAFAYHFRKLFDARAMLDKGANPREICSALRIWGDTGAFFAQLRNITLKQTGDSLQHLAEIDHAIKTGQAKAPAAIEQLVLKLASPKR